jgi:hypothetical protein
VIFCWLSFKRLGVLGVSPGNAAGGFPRDAQNLEEAQQGATDRMADDDHDGFPSIGHGEEDLFDDQVPAFEWMPLSQPDVITLDIPARLPLLSTPPRMPASPLRGSVNLVEGPGVPRCPGRGFPPRPQL